MNDLAPIPRTAPDRIVLGEQPDIALGGIRVRSSLCEVEVRERRESVEPRVMQVLLALARVPDTVVSRDELVRLCWDGRIVGDDAISGCVAKVRRLASLTDPPAFVIDTVPRVGYRLRPTEAARPAAAPAEPPAEAAAETAVEAPVAPTAPRRFPRVVAIALGAGLMVAVAIAIVIRLPVHSSPRWTVVRSEIPISEWAIQRHPAISPDGAVIAYSGGDDPESRQIYFKHVVGGEAVRLTHDAYDDTSPSWSPDGSEIAYVAFKRGEPCRLLVTPVPAGSPRELGRCRNAERSHLAWAHSGDELFFLDSDAASSPQRVMRFDLATGRRAPLERTGNGGLDEEDPAASPDGSWVAFPRCSGDAACRLIVFELQTGKERVVGAPSNFHGATWSADSATLFFVTEEDGDFTLWSWPAAGGEPVRILSSPHVMDRLSAGPRGLLAVEIEHVEAELAEASEHAGEDLQLLDPTRGNEWGPDIAPGGTIAFIAERSGGVGLWLKPKGEAPHRLIALHGEGTEISEPRWSPDGSEIALVAPVGAGLGLRVVSASGADVMAVPFAGLMLRTPAWTSDGKALIFPGRDEHGWQLWRLDLTAPGAPKPLGKRGWRYIRAQGDALYGVRDDAPGVWRIDDPPQLLVPTIIRGDPPAAWTIVGGDVVYREDAACEHGRVLAQPIAGGSARVLAETPGDCAGGSLAVDPESGKIVYSVVQDFGSDIELLRLALE